MRGGGIQSAIEGFDGFGANRRQKVLLAKPETYMNLSGLSVAALARELEIDPQRGVDRAV